MTTSSSISVHPRHAQLVEDLEDYLIDLGRSARWLGMVTAHNPRLMEGLKRGQDYDLDVMILLHERLLNYYTAKLALEVGATRLAA